MNGHAEPIDSRSFPSIHRYDQFVAQSFVVSFILIMNEESSNSSARRGLAELNQLVKFFGFQRFKETLQMCIQVWTPQWQANWLHAFVV